MILRRSHLSKIIVQYLRRNSAYQCKAFVWVRQKGFRMYRCFIANSQMDMLVLRSIVKRLIETGFSVFTFSLIPLKYGVG